MEYLTLMKILKDIINGSKKQIRKEGHDKLEEILERTDEPEVSIEMLEKIEDGTLKEPIENVNKVVEWECDEEKEVTEEMIRKRKREWVTATKKETTIWAYETIFNWLEIKFDKEHKEQFWKAIDYDRTNDQEKLYEIRLREIIEFEMKGKDKNGGMKIQKEQEEKEPPISKVNYSLKIMIKKFPAIKEISTTHVYDIFK
jgi:hypothetical protein